MATLVRFREPFREFTSLQNDMARLMSGLIDGDGNGRTNQAWAPAVDVWETETELVYAFDLPGIPEDKISVELEDNALTVSAERERSEEVADERFYRSSAASAPSRARSACRRARPTTRCTPTTRTACSRSTSPSRNSRSRGGSRSARPRTAPP